MKMILQKVAKKYGVHLNKISLRKKEAINNLTEMCFNQ